MTVANLDFSHRAPSEIMHLFDKFEEDPYVDYVKINGTKGCQKAKV